MGLAGVLTQPVVIEHWEDTDASDQYGNPVRAKVGEVDELGYLEQTDATEIQVDRDTLVSTCVLIVRPGAVVRGGDRVRYRDDVYEVLGRPALRWHPCRRADHHIEARLRVADG